MNRQTLKQTMKKRSGLLAGMLFAVGASVLVLTAQAAGGASLSLSPSNSSYTVNTNFAISLYENSGSEAVNGVDVKLVYDTSKLQFISVNTAGSPFSTCPQANGGGGTVTVTCALLGGSTTGNQLVGSATFKALVGSGSTAITFGSGSAITNSTTNADVWNHNTAGGSYGFTTPPPPPPPPSTPTPTPTPAPTPSTPKAPSKKPSTSSSPSQSSSTTAAPSPTEVAAQQADPSAPVVVNNTASEQPSYLVAIKTLDSSGKIMKSASVQLDKKTTKSDVTGVASFVRITAGKHTVRLTSKEGSLTSSITVKGNTSPAKVQQFTLRLKQEGLNPLVFIIPLVIILLLGGLGIVAYQNGGLMSLIEKIRARFASQKTSPVASDDFSTQPEPQPESSEDLDNLHSSEESSQENEEEPPQDTLPPPAKP